MEGPVLSKYCHGVGAMDALISVNSDPTRLQDELSTRIALLRSPNDLLIESQFRNQNDPNRPPPHDPGGDGWIILGMIVGAGTGVVLGFVLGYNFNIGDVFFDVAAGAVMGGIIGTYVGDMIKKAKRKRRAKRRANLSQK
jgi:predicted lipid-binding transport protein (Tim44 family)